MPQETKMKLISFVPKLPNIVPKLEKKVFFFFDAGAECANNESFEWSKNEKYSHKLHVRTKIHRNLWEFEHALNERLAKGASAEFASEKCALRSNYIKLLKYPKIYTFACAVYDETVSSTTSRKDCCFEPLRKFLSVVAFRNTIIYKIPKVHTFESKFIK